MRKLVRDLIPQIVFRREGAFPVTTRADKIEHEELLRDKLEEEVEEYLTDRGVEELADVYEVLVALAEVEGYDEEDLLTVVHGKRVARGGFGGRVVLLAPVESYKGSAPSGD